MIIIRRLILSSIVFLVLFSFISDTEKTISVGKVENQIVSGNLAGNRNLEFGVANILEEALQDQDYFLDPSSELRLEVNILFFGKQKATAQLAVYSRNVDITNVILEGILYRGDKKIKTKVVKGQSKNISTATLIIDQGGEFSQAAVSTALKKACIELIEKLKL